ncbi:VanW family protein [Candidatus Gracilibacteria bacterium]|nr:VanW family protein [Candidatus Gracilibacteria bacterium]
MQYFSFARFELHGEQVVLTRLGSQYSAPFAETEPFAWLVMPDTLEPGRSFVAESGHTLGGAFAWYHQHKGGVALLGYPISEEFFETQPDGSAVLVQYFERARLSYHPAEVGTAHEVQRLDLGRLAAEMQLTPAQQQPSAAPVSEPTALLSTSLRYTSGSDAGHNIELAAARLHGAQVDPGATLSFLDSIGEVSAATGYVGAGAIVNGTISDDVIGGGICDVSTALYRAAWQGGLPIRERHGHSYWLKRYADQPGLEAAVFAGALDLRIANDTVAPLYIAARAEAGLLTVTIWGGRRRPLCRQRHPRAVVPSGRCRGCYYAQYLPQRR